MTGDPAVAEELHTLIRRWEVAHQPALTWFTAIFDQTGASDTQLWTPHRWALVESGTAVGT